jgi:hypothetical protein
MIWPKTYLIHEPSGNIPNCLFSMPSLVSLHLSGNRFNGKDNYFLNSFFLNIIKFIIFLLIFIFRYS